MSSFRYLARPAPLALLLLVWGCGSPSGPQGPSSDDEAGEPGDAPARPDLVGEPPGDPVVPALNAGDPDDTDPAEQPAAPGTPELRQCGGTCEQTCACLAVACGAQRASAGNCDGLAAACQRECVGSRCSIGDPDCARLVQRPQASDPDGPVEPPGGAGPDPSPVDR
jgi:hypothetical protein